MAETTTGAESLFKEFKEHSVAEFFKKNRQMLGYSGKIRSLTTIVHEYVTNALDACEDHGVLPDIFVRIERLGNDYYRVTATDNGPGIPQSHVGKVFAQMLAGTKFHRFMQARGQQGIGASGCTLYSQITTGKPTHVTSGTGKGIIYECDIMLDAKNNSPIITSTKEYEGPMKGTKIVAEFKDVTFNKSEYSVGEYLRRTAVANPHAKITFIDPDNEKVAYERVVNVLPKKAKAELPHPAGLTVDDLLDYANRSQERTVKTFLMNNFARMSGAKVGEIEGLTSIDFQRKPDSVTWKDAEEIVDAIRKTKFLAPSTSSLCPIGQDHVEKAILNVLNPTFHAIITRSPTVYRGGVPFQVEAGIAFEGKSGRGEATGPNDAQEEGTDGENGGGKKVEIMRYANRVPLLFDAGSDAITKSVNDIDWKRYGIKSFDNMPVTIFVNVVSTYIPYTSAGKQAISDEEDIVKEIKFALMDVGRQLKSYLSSQHAKYETAEKKNILMTYVPETAGAVAKLAKGEKKEVTLLLLKIIDAKFVALAAGAKDEDETPAEENADAESEPEGADAE